MSRESDMIDMYVSGLTYREIGEIYGVSRQRIHQILKPFGITWVDGGAHLISQKRLAEYEARLEAKIQDKYQITLSDYREFMANGYKYSWIRAYQNHRNNHKKDGYNLSFKDWWEFLSSHDNYEDYARGGYSLVRRTKNLPWSKFNLLFIPHSEAVVQGRGWQEEWYRD